MPRATRSTPAAGVAVPARERANAAGDGADRASGRRGRPRGDTRGRILDTALDLFTDRGYDKTSLREIADELRLTKAALYYHFERKEDILLALHLRMHALGRGALEDLGRGGAVDLEQWAQLLDNFVDQVSENRKLFLLHTRNQSAFEQLKDDVHNAAEHQDMEQTLQRVLSNPALPPARRVRMACSIGAVFGAMMGAGEALADIPSAELSTLVRAALSDLLAEPGHDRPRPPARRRR